MAAMEMAMKAKMIKPGLGPDLERCFCCWAGMAGTAVAVGFAATTLRCVVPDDAASMAIGVDGDAGVSAVGVEEEEAATGAGLDDIELEGADDAADVEGSSQRLSKCFLKTGFLRL